MTSKERVSRAIHFNNPDKTPILFFNKDFDKADALIVGYRERRDLPDGDGVTSEWGYVWERIGNTMGLPHSFPLTDWDNFETFKKTVPNPDESFRYELIPSQMAKYPDRYFVGTLGITGFNVVTFIRGFENSLEDLYCDRENIEHLIDIVFDYECGIIRNLAKFKVSGIFFYDDWGTQSNLMISPDLWREVFAPRYKKQFDLVHELGMDVWFHSCGNIYDIIPDLIELGADVLNLNQPDIFGIENLGKQFGGKICFNCPVDHQTVAISGTHDEIFDYVKRLSDNLGSYGGGLVSNIEEYSSVGMSDENYNNIVEAFTCLRDGKL